MKAFSQSGLRIEIVFTVFTVDKMKRRVTMSLDTRSDCKLEGRGWALHCGEHRRYTVSVLHESLASFRLSCKGKKHR